MPLEPDAYAAAVKVAHEAMEAEHLQRARIFLEMRTPEIMAADAALARVAVARALAADATSSAAQAKRSLGPAETALRKAEARMVSAAPKDRQAAAALHALATTRLREARDTAARAAQEAIDRRVALATTLADARSYAVKPAIRAHANECRLWLESAGTPWEPPADMRPRQRLRLLETDSHGKPPKDISV